VLVQIMIGAGESMRKDPAFEIAAEGSLGIGRRCSPAQADKWRLSAAQYGLARQCPQREICAKALR